MFKFKQKDSEFFDLFVESAQYFYQGALMMDEVMLDYSKAADKVKEVVDLEHAADAVNDKIIDKLNLTFITPIDREDIYALANSLDDGVDLLGEGGKSGMERDLQPRQGGVIGLGDLEPVYKYAHSKSKTSDL